MIYVQGIEIEGIHELKSLSLGIWMPLTNLPQQILRKRAIILKIIKSTKQFCRRAVVLIDFFGVENLASLLELIS